MSDPNGFEWAFFGGEGGGKLYQSARYAPVSWKDVTIGYRLCCHG